MVKRKPLKVCNTDTSVIVCNDSPVKGVYNGFLFEVEFPNHTVKKIINDMVKAYNSCGGING